ncbi:MAG: hypothetical protein IJY28_07875 [Clostridia bacterium]|nr:hypothetical protein [Clostridia bacterium]
MQITHDFHIHTSLSLCGDPSATVENYRATAQKLGLKKIGFSDHFWDERISTAHLSQMGKDFYVPQNYPYICQLRPQLAAQNWGNTKVYFGAEVDYDLRRRDLCITEETAEQLDFLLVPNSHTHLIMPRDCYQPYQKHLDFMVQIFEDTLNSPVSKYVTAMAHPFEAVCCPYDNNILMHMLPEDTLKRLCAKAAEKGVAYEINVSAIRGKTEAQIADWAQMRLFRIAKEAGCKFIFGSDSHSAWAHDTWAHDTDVVSKLLGLTENDFHPITR